MSQYQIVDTTWLEENLTNIADAIREKTGEGNLLEFPEGMISAIKSIKEQGGGGENKLNQLVTNNLKNVTAEDLQGATSLKDYLFDNSPFLQSVVIPDSVTSIGAYTFQNCYTLQNLTIGNGVTYIGTYSFNNCSYLPSVIIPDSVTTLGTYAFAGCSSLYYVKLGNGITKISQRAFSGCKALKTLTLPNTITAINSEAFAYSGIETIDIPDSVATIASSAFESSNIQSITIGSGITSIGTGVFRNRKTLISVTIKSDTPPTIQSSTFQSINADCVFRVKNLALYAEATNWSDLVNTYTFEEITE